MPDPVDKPCRIEAASGEVIVECGGTVASLTSEVADRAAGALADQAQVAAQQDPDADDDAGDR